MTKYPLTWPAGWRRTASYQRRRAQFSQDRQRLTITRGADRVLIELCRLGIDTSRNVIISSNLRVRKDGSIIGDQKMPDDPGVAVYWKKPKDPQHKVMATDRYDRVEDNLAAIAATLDAMRAIERHGGAVILERAFTGFLALPAPNTWKAVMGFDDDDVTMTNAVVRSRYKRLAMERHPDHCGSDAKMAELNWAMQQAERELS